MATVLKFIAAACLLLAVATLFLAAPQYWRQYRVLREWPRVDGEVISSRVVEHDTAAGPLYATELQFVFTLQGQPVVGGFVFPHESTSRVRKLKQVSDYPVGSHHIIAYNPADPSDIRIRPGYNVEFFVIPVFLTGVAFLFIFAAGAIWMVARRLRPNRLAI